MLGHETVYGVELSKVLSILDAVPAEQLKPKSVNYDLYQIHFKICNAYFCIFVD